MRRIPITAALILGGLSLGFAGCASKNASSTRSAGSAMPGADSAEAGYGDIYRSEAEPEYASMDEDMDMDDAAYDEPMEAPVMPTTITASGAPSKSMKKMDRSDPKPAPAPEPPPPATKPTTGTGSKGSGGKQADVKPEKNDDLAVRHIIYTAQMRISVFDLDSAMHKAEDLPDTYGGYIQSMNDSVIVLRIPSANLRRLMSDLGDYGVIESRSLQAQDVTAEFTDVTSRIKALTETQTQLLALLSKARNVEEALHVRRALDDVNTQLEVLKGRLRQLENMTTYSTLTLQLIERGPDSAPPSSNDPFPWVNSLGIEATEWR